MSGSQRAFVVVGGVAELILTTVAMRDLARRAPDEIRGPKSLWRIGCFVQPFGPPAYLLFGRRDGAEAP